MGKINELTRIVGRSLSRNSPTILTGVGIAGFVSAVIMAAKATPTFTRTVDEINRHYLVIEDKLPTNEDIFMQTWKIYAPTAGMVVLSASCLILSNRISLRRQATLMSLYALADGTLRDYQQAVIDKFGTKKERGVRDAISQKLIDDNPQTEKTTVGTRSEGDHLCYDSISGRYFYSTKQKIMTAQNEFNNQLMSNMTMTLNELYYELGLPNNDIGNSVGWTMDIGLVDISIDTMMAKNEEPCIVVNHRKPPEWLYF